MPTQQNHLMWTVIKEERHKSSSREETTRARAPRRRDGYAIRSMHSDDYAIRRQRRQSLMRKNTSNPKFHTQFQEQVYEEFYMHNRFANHKYVDWDHIESLDVFSGTWRMFQDSGIHHLVSLKSDYNEEVIRQFYATLWISPNYEHIEWMTGEHYLSSNRSEFEAALNTYSSQYEKVFGTPPIPLHQCSEFYDWSIRFTPGKSFGLLPIPSLINRIINHIIMPKSGNYDTIRGHVWNVIRYITTGTKFDVIDLILREMDDAKNDRTQRINFAPYIMKLIIHKTGPFRGGKGGVHKPYKPRETQLPPRPSATAAHPGASSSQPQGGQGPQEGDISMAQLYSAVMGLSSSMTSLTDNMATMSVNITSLTEQFSSLSGDFSSLSGHINALGDRMTALENAVAPRHYVRTSRRRRDSSPQAQDQAPQD